MSGCNGRFAVLLIAVLGAPILHSFAGVSFAQSPAATTETPIEDGWRRTASGWEQIADWRLAAAYSSVPSWRVDFHPAALALLQALVIAAAFRVFSGKTRAGRTA